MRSQKLGDQELAVLRYVTDHGPASVRQVAVAFESLARTTILTVLERLRSKGYVSREREDGAFVYSATQDQQRVTSGLIGEFIKSKLGGSVGSFVAYLSHSEGLTDDEVAELKRIAVKLDRREGDD